MSHTLSDSAARSGGSTAKGLSRAQPQAVLQSATDRVLPRATAIPIIAARPSAPRMQRQQDVAQLRFADAAVADTQPDPFGDRHVPPHRFRIEPKPRGDALCATPSRQRRSTSDISTILTARYIHNHPPRAKARDRRPLSRRQTRGKGFEKVVTLASIGF